MNTKASVLSMAAIFFLLEVLTLAYAYIFSTANKLPLRTFAQNGIILCVMVSFLGLLIGLLFAKIRSRIPIANIQLAASIFLVVLNLILTLVMGLKKLAESPIHEGMGLAFTLITSYLMGYIFGWLYSKFPEPEPKLPKLGPLLK